MAEPFLAYDGCVDALTGGVFLTGVYLGFRRHRLRAVPGIALALAGLFFAFLICPFSIRPTGFIDARFTIMLGLLLFAGLRPVPLAPRVRIAIGMVLALAFLGRAASLAEVWLDHNRDLAAFRRVTATVAPGSRVLVVLAVPEATSQYWADLPRGCYLQGFYPLCFHLPALLTIEHRAFFPYLFTMAAKQPLIVRAPFDRISIPEGLPPDWQSLVVGSQVNPLTPAPYLKDWRHGYDYVLLLNAGGAAHLDQFLSSQLRLVDAGDVAALYRIRRD